MPAHQSRLIELIWDQFLVLIPSSDPYQWLRCHRPRIPDRLVFDGLVQILVFGSAYHRIADATCSATILRRRRYVWIAPGVMEQLVAMVLAAYDRPIELDRVRDLHGGAATAHLRRDDSGLTRERLAARGLQGQIAPKGSPAPIAASSRWPVERAAWTNAHKKLIWCTERRARVVVLWVAFSTVVIIVRRLIRVA